MKPAALYRANGMTRVLSALVLSSVALAGCEMPTAGDPDVARINSDLEAADAPEPSLAAAGSVINPGLAPAPEVFQERGLVVWDGSQTLQGIWVAHPQAETARRVRIMDTETNRAVDGALFRRDASISGSSVLISSEAAGILGLEPHRKSELLIVALKPAETVPVTAEAPPASEDPVEEAVEAAEDTADIVAEALPEPALEEPDAALDTPEVAALPEPEEDLAAEVTPQELPPSDAPEPIVAAATEAEAGGDDVADIAVLPEPVVPGSDEPATAPEETAAAPASADATVALPAEEPAPASPPVRPPEPPVAASSETTDEAPAETAAPALSGNRFVLAGVFGVEENAQRLIGNIREAGFPARGEPLNGRSGTLTRVIAGPFASADDQDAALRSIRALGVPDAIPTTR